MTTHSTITNKAMRDCMDELAVSADASRLDRFLFSFGRVLAGQWPARERFERRFHLHDTFDRAGLIRSLLKYDAEQRSKGIPWLVPVDRWNLCGLLVCEGRAMRADRKMAETIQRMKVAAE